MCILFIYTDPEPEKGGYRLIIASNRDEFYRRPAKDAFMCAKTNVIGGRDMESGREGGMWLGVSTSAFDECKFRFGALLNVTSPDRKCGVKGRGGIVYDYVADDILAESYIDMLQNSTELYNAFNFVAVELGLDFVQTYHSSNAPSEVFTYKGKQTLGFGNSTATSPLQKVIGGKERFQNIINKFNNVQHKENLANELMQLLKWEEKHLPDPELEKRAPDAIDFLCSVYVKYIKAAYGTRTHSVILVDYDWNVEFIESTMNEPIQPETPTWNTVNISAHL